MPSLPADLFQCLKALLDSPHRHRVVIEIEAGRLTYTVTTLPGEGQRSFRPGATGVYVVNVDRLNSRGVT